MKANTLKTHGLAKPIIVDMVMIDLDGTLIHTAPDLATAANRMLGDLKMGTYPDETVQTWIGNGVSRIVKRALTGTMQGEPEDELFRTGLSLFHQHYAEDLSDRSRPYPGVVEGLDALQAMNFDLACITNKAEKFTLPLLEALGLRDYFKLVLSGDSLPKRKPDPLPLTHACDYFKITPAQGVLIGDSINDIQAAQAAGMPILCVDYGYDQGLDLTQSNPDAMIGSLEVLPDLLERL